MFVQCNYLMHDIKRAADFRFCAIAVALLLVTTTAHAFQFVPQSAEWAVWSPLCKARYSVTKAANSSPYANSVPASEVAAWKSRVGDYSWEHMHHFCAGQAYLYRARTELNPGKKQEYLVSASREAGYTYNWLTKRPGQSLLPDVAITLAMIKMEQGNPLKGVNYLEKAALESPGDANVYLAMYTIYRRGGDRESAYKALLRGDEATGGASAEISYYLGMASLDRGDVDDAIAYAKKAYGAGFQMPALRRRLAEAGHSI